MIKLEHLRIKKNNRIFFEYINYNPRKIINDNKTEIIIKI
jgi:hypothetical protein